MSLQVEASDIPAAGHEQAPVLDASSGESWAEGAQAGASAVPPPAPRALVRPRAADRYEIRSTAGAETCDQLRRAQELLAHAVPTGNVAQVFDRALTLLVDDLERKKFAATDRPRRSRGQSEDSRNMPASVRRAVRKRDGDRCAWVATNGRRCGERRFLEFHHDDPYAAGGRPTIDRVRLLCRTHNRYEAELFYGPGRRYSGADVAREPFVRYGSLTSTRPVLGRVVESKLAVTP